MTDPAQPTRSGPSPRALRTMSLVRWLLLALVSALAVFTVVTIWLPDGDDHAAHGGDQYTCPMHPQIRAPGPGECPICHMALVPIPKDRRAPASPSDTGHVHGAHSPSPAGVTGVIISEEKQRAVGIVTTRVSSKSAGERLRVPGVLSAPETGRSEVRVRAPGFIERVSIRQSGVRVSAGQPLAFVYSPEVYRAQEEFLALSRWDRPLDGGPVRAESADLTRASRRGLELLGLTPADIEEIVRTGQPIRALPLRAPAGGVVTRTSAVLGARADPEVVLYEVSDLSTLWILASVHERDLSALKVGATARFLQANTGSEAILGKIELFEPLLDEATRSARVRLSLKNPDGLLRPGQYGEVEFDLPARTGLFVPRDAVIRTGEADYVYVRVDRERFEPRRVQTGISREGLVEVTSGITAEQEVVSRGSFMLDSESRLRASLEASAGAEAP